MDHKIYVPFAAVLNKSEEESAAGRSAVPVDVENNRLGFSSSYS